MRCYCTKTNNEFAALCPFYISYGIGDTKDKAIIKMCRNVIDTVVANKLVGTYDPSIWGLYWIQWFLDIFRLPSQRSTFKVYGVETLQKHLEG